jgi:trimeric autotransporter adhesin
MPAAIRTGLAWERCCPQLHTTSTVRFEGVAATAANTVNTRFLTIDNSGNVAWSNVASGPGGVSLNCSTTNYVPKVTGSGTLGCSIIYDNGSGVGINTTVPRTFSTSTTPFYDQVVGSPSNGTVATLDVNGMTFTNTLVVSSDRRLKTNIRPIANSLATIKKLNGVTYVWDRQKHPGRNFDGFYHAGFIAQDLEKVFPEAVVVDQKGEYAVNYNTFAPLLAEGVKELSNTVDAQKATIEQFTQRLAAMEKRLQSMEQGYGAAPADFDGYYLSQNAPNPYDQQTTIQYAIPGSFNEASIRVYDMNGNAVMTKNLGNSNRGSVTLGREDLRAGTYIYTLVVDGKEQVKKKMMAK